MRGLLPPLLAVLLLGTVTAQPASAKIEVVSEAAAVLFSSKQYVVRSTSVEGDLMLQVAEPTVPLKPGQKGAAIYILDSNFSFGLTTDLARLLQLGGEIVPTYVVAIGYPTSSIQIWSKRRVHDYLHQTTSSPASPAVGGGGANFEKFLREEVRPFVEGRYAIDADNVILAGHSFGGLFTANVLVQHPDAFTGYLVSSPSIWAGGEELKRLTAAFAKKKGVGTRKVYVSVGELEGKDNVAASETFSGQLATAKNGLQIRSETLPKETHYSVPGQSIARGMVYLLGPPAPATAK